MKVLDPDKLYRLVSGQEATEKMAHEKKLRDLFWAIIEEWEEESDIDYSIPLQDILELVEKSPDFFVERMGVIDMVKAMSTEALQLKPVRKSRKRVL